MKTSLIIQELAITLIFAGAFFRPDRDAAAEENWKISDVKCVWNDGCHNAFTDLTEFKGNYFLSFRHATEHQPAGRGEIYVLSSPDLVNWKLAQTYQFSQEEDGRDMKFFKLSNRLGMMYTVTSSSGPRTFNNYVVFSDDGLTFSSPLKIENFNYYPWRNTFHDNKLYLSAYAPAKKGLSSCLFGTTDGMEFAKISEIAPNASHAGESAIIFIGKNCYAVTRDEGRPRKNAVLSIANDPYEKWVDCPLAMPVDCAAIFQFKDKIMLAARFWTKPNCSEMAVYSLDIPSKQLHKEAVLPSKGESGHCGVIVQGDKLYVSYYSAHVKPPASKVSKAFPTGIFLATLEFDRKD
ncbi:MAG: hypothetical protein PHV34_12235 [Verrucomicrobiae bacterium]|nr:hypothetical protein [Verrucomicrobiae bacterium]